MTLEPVSDPRALKRELRRETVARILALDPTPRRRQESELAERFAALPGYSGAGVVLLYVSALPEEFSTRPMLRSCLDSGRRLILPRVQWRARRLLLCEVRDLDNDLAPGRLDIPEPRPACPAVDPAAVDWVLVPGLAFDERAHRLGRGAGYYDRLLPALRPDAPRWALALDEQWVPSLPVEPHDQPLDGVAFPSRTIYRGS